MKMDSDLFVTNRGAGVGIAYSSSLIMRDSIINKLVSLEARLVRNYNRVTESLTGGEA